LSNITHKIPLDTLNTFQVSATAKHFIQIESVEQLLQDYKEIKQYPNRMVLGGGSNCLFVDSFDGLIIYPQLKGIKVIKETPEHIELRVAASENWHQFVQYCLNRDYFGLENLALIPGTVGAAPVQNIGAYGVEVESFITTVDCFDFSTGEQIVLNNEECGFGYRDSIIKRAAQGRYLVTHVSLVLSKKLFPVISYAPLKAHFSNNKNISATQIFDKVVELRQQKLPDPEQLPNAGSFFKNPVVSNQQYKQLLNGFPEIVAYPLEDRRFKLAAGWLIERAGLKGKTFGKVGVHKNQALVLVNYSDNDGKNILRLAETVIKKVFELFAITLEPEVRIFQDSMQ
jgi:UDP-N-acetylmuramate dehydrogenase